MPRLTPFFCVTLTVPRTIRVTVTDPQGGAVAGADVQVYSAGTPTGKAGQTDARGQVSFVLADGEYQFRAEYDGSVAWSEACQVPGCETASLSVSPAAPDRVVTITYTYDDLYRLEAADYASAGSAQASTGDFYRYAYDAVGNRLSQESLLNGVSLATAYNYDAANRLTGVSTGSTIYDPLGAITYDWDSNGNLLSDGVNTYTYDAANRLATFNGSSSSVSYSYNGLNDRLQETVNGSTTTFTMDLNTGLTQALSDGTYTYTYGLGRIAQYDTTAEYFLGDALGSVRQLTDAQGQITLAKAYNPYGEVTQSAGAGQSSYGYTNEYQDSYIKLIYLRSRYLSPETGRFQTRDTWQGDYNRPLSLNRWNYVEANPVNLTDPSGRFPEWCKTMGDRLQYENCVRRYYGLSAPRDYQTMPHAQGQPGCWSGPVAYKAPGYLEGLSGGVSFGVSLNLGKELVFDFATMEKGLFNYFTTGLTLEAGGSAMEYHGIVFNFNNVNMIEEKYNGSFYFGSAGANTGFPGINLGVGVTGFYSFDQELWGLSEYYSVGAGISLIPGVSVSGGVGKSTWNGYKISYIKQDGRVNVDSLIADITFDFASPAVIPVPSNLVKGIGIELAIYYSWIHDEMYVNSK